MLWGVAFTLDDHEKAAVVGINGAGKTTLLRIIIGELSADQGTVTLARDKTIGYLSQQEAVSGDCSVYDELLSVKQEIVDLERRMRSVEMQMNTAPPDRLQELMDDYAGLTHAFETANGYAYKSELTGVLKGLGFAKQEFHRSISTLSGGQKTRVALGKLLLQNPDMIILDEPTNHLDMSSTAWLETYLKNYKGAVLVVSHDRYFLDKTVTKIIELDNAECTVFAGSYSDYAVKKEALRAARYNTYMRQQREIRHQEEVIDKLRSFNREKSVRRAESREKKLAKMELLDKPAEVRADMRLTLTPRYESGNDVLRIQGLAKSFGALTLFRGLDMDIKKGEHVAVIGDNGTGKTTLLKIINGLISPDAGTVRIGANVQIGYYDQEHHVLHMDKTLFEEISDDYPTLTNTEIRNTLAAFLFTGEDVFKQIKSLSGGERGRVSLARLMLSEANFLILDEPTNHLDIMSKEILEDALNAYTGTVLYVSHDRYFINRTASRILELNRGTLTSYLGNYDYYLEKKEELSAPDNAASAGADASLAGTLSDRSGGSADQKNASDKVKAADSGGGRLDWQKQKEEQALLRRRENERKKCEDRIELLEKRNQEIDLLMASPEVCTDVARLQELNGERASNDRELADLYEKWEQLAE